MTSEKSVKVYVRVRDPKTGEESLTVAGRSHPGEVRMLRKNGLAEWVDGKIILNLIPAPVETKEPPRKKWEGIDSHIRRLATEGSLFKNPAADSQGFRPDSNTGERIYGEPRPEEVTCADAGAWFRKIAEERRAGHTLYVSDDPRNLRLGFVSDEVDTVWYLGIRHIKIATPEDTAPMLEFGYTHEQVRGSLGTEAGRNGLLGSADETFISGKPLPEKPAYEGPEDTSQLLELLLAGDAEVLPESGVEERAGTPFWEAVALGLAGGFIKPQNAPVVDPGDPIVPSLQYSERNYWMEPGIRRNYEVVRPDTSEDLASEDRPSKEPSQSLGWAKFEYPRDRERVPLITQDGAEYPAVFRGTFRRKGFDLEVRTEEGREFTATMKKWTLAEVKELGKKYGYAVPE